MIECKATNPIAPQSLTFADLKQNDYFILVMKGGISNTDTIYKKHESTIDGETYNTINMNNGYRTNTCSHQNVRRVKDIKITFTIEW